MGKKRQTKNNWNALSSDRGKTTYIYLCDDVCWRWKWGEKSKIKCSLWMCGRPKLNEFMKRALIHGYHCKCHSKMFVSLVEFAELAVVYAYVVDDMWIFATDTFCFGDKDSHDIALPYFHTHTFCLLVFTDKKKHAHVRLPALAACKCPLKMTHIQK